MKKITAVLIFTLIAFLSYSNSAIDSLLNQLTKKQKDPERTLTYCRLAISYSEVDPDEGINYAQKGLELAEKKNYTEGKASANAALGVALFKKGKYNEATDFLERSLGLYRGMNDVLGQGFVVGKMADNYNASRRYPQALELYFQTLRFREVQRDSNGIAIALENIASVYFKLDQQKSGTEQLHKALDVLRSSNNKEELAHCYYQMATLLFNGHYECDSSIYFLRKAVKIADEIGEERAGLEYKNLLSGKLYECASKSEGKKMAEEVLEKAIEKKYELAMVGGYENMAMIFNSEGNYAKGLEYGMKALNIAKQRNEPIRYMNIYGCLQRSYRGLNDLKNAFTYLELYSQVKDSLRNDSTTKHFENIQAGYVAEKNEKERIKNAYENDKLEADAQQGSIKAKAVVVIIFLIGLLVFVMLTGIRTKQKLSKEITEQKMILEDKDLEIMNSISHAKSLQDAILPPHSFMKQYFPESFIFFRPKDVVSGDFYWMEVVGDHIFLAVADCTGQGVSGAMVSVVCSSALNRSVKEFGITDTGKILDKVSMLVLETFRKKENDVNDGMDISLIRINKSTNEVQWSGANNSLWYVQNNEIKEIEANKQSIGKSEKKDPFIAHAVPLQKGDSVFLFTDGYADQFGEESGKKFKYVNLKKLLLSIADRKLPEQKIIIDAKLERWKGKLPQVDDILVVGVRV